MDTQSKDFRFFVDHHDEIFKEYPNSFVVIQKEKVLFSSPSLDEAVKEAMDRKLTLGTFIIQECTEGKSAYTQTFHSRVVFA